MADTAPAQDDTVAALEGVGDAVEDGREAGESGEAEHNVEPSVIEPPACPILAKLYGNSAFERIELVPGLPLSRIVAAVWVESGAEVRPIEGDVELVLWHTPGKPLRQPPGTSKRKLES